MKTVIAGIRSPYKNKTNLFWASVRRYWEFYVFLIPALAYVAIFYYGPMYGIQIAFKNFNPALGMGKSPWVGLTHFISFF